MPTLFQLGQIISHIPKTNGNPSKFKGSLVSPPCGANSIGGCSTIVGGQIMTIWQASLCFVDYNNFEKHFTFPGRLQFIVCLQLRPPQKENALISGYWIKSEGLWTCICLGTTIGLANQRVSESWATGGEICLNQG